MKLSRSAKYRLALFGKCEDLGLEVRNTMSNDKLEKMIQRTHNQENLNVLLKEAKILGLNLDDEQSVSSLRKSIAKEKSNRLRIELEEFAKTEKPKLINKGKALGIELSSDMTTEEMLIKLSKKANKR